MKFGLGWKPDKPDPRDRPFATMGLKRRVPVSASLKPHVLSVLDQGPTLKCVAHAWAQALRIVDHIAGATNPGLASREFIYYNACAEDGNAGQDEGTQLRSGAKGVMRFGRPSESFCPFRAEAVSVRPSWAAYRAGYDARGPRGYYRIAQGDFGAIHTAIANGHPIVFGTDAITDSFESYSGGVFDLTDEPSLGGHALTLIGYDIPGAKYSIVNSWGKLWGMDGFCDVTPRWLARASDLWAVAL